MRLYLMRHADPDYKTDTLSSQGCREAEALAEGLAAEGPTRLYCSVTGRSRATAQAIARRTGLAVESLPWLNEPRLHVVQGGKPYALWDAFGESVRGGPTLPDRETWNARPPFDAPEVGAMWRAFRGNADAFLASHGCQREEGRYRILRRGAQKLALVSHNGTVLLFLAHLLELPLPLVFTGFFIWPGSVTVIHFEEQSETWAVPRALCVADTSHLRAAGLRPVPRGMGVEPFPQYL